MQTKRKYFTAGAVGAVLLGGAFAAPVAMAQPQGGQGQGSASFSPSSGQPGTAGTLTVQCPTGYFARRNVKDAPENQRLLIALELTTPEASSQKLTIPFTVKPNAQAGSYKLNARCIPDDEGEEIPLSASFTVKPKDNTTPPTSKPTQTNTKPAPQPEKPGTKPSKPGQGGSQIPVKPHGSVNTGGGGTAF